jgi:hypothetical protein
VPDAALQSPGFGVRQWTMGGPGIRRMPDRRGPWVIVPRSGSGLVVAGGVVFWAATCRWSEARSLPRCRWPLTLRNSLAASLIPAAHQRNAIWPSRQFLTLAECSQHMPILDSIGVGSHQHRRPHHPPRPWVPHSASAHELLPRARMDESAPRAWSPPPIAARPAQTLSPHSAGRTGRHPRGEPPGHPAPR